MRFEKPQPCAACGAPLWSTKARKFHACRGRKGDAPATPEKTADTANAQPKTT